MKEFKGKTALITGAAYGFGKEFKPVRLSRTNFRQIRT